MLQVTGLKVISASDQSAAVERTLTSPFCIIDLAYLLRVGTPSIAGFEPGLRVLWSGNFDPGD